MRPSRKPALQASGLARPCHVTPPAWTWIALTIMAAFAQTLRNAAQRRVSGTQGPLPATLTRFVFGLPFAALWLWLVMRQTGSEPAFNASFALWCAFGAVGQLFATAFLLVAMSHRNFVVSVVYSKTEVVQLAVFSWLVLGDALPGASMVAVIIATVGVIVLSTDLKSLKSLTFLRDLGTPAAGWGFASGAAFAVSVIGYRGAALSVPETPPFLAAAFGLVFAQALQSVLLSTWLWFRQPGALKALAGEWRISLAAGLLGTIASVGWFTSFALHSGAEVRTLGMVEILFSYAVSRKLLKEKVSGAEIAGGAMVMAGVALICLGAA